MEYVISANVANLQDFSNEQLLDYIAKLPLQSNSLEFYEYIPPIPGIYARANKWRVIVADIGMVMGIASSLWTLYEGVIKPNLPKDSTAGVMYRIENAGFNNNFWIGNNVKSKEELMNLVQDSLQQVEIDKMKREIDSMRTTPRWRRIR